MLDMIKTLANGILEQVKSFRGDWNVNDISSPHYIKNRTHYTEKKYVDVLSQKTFTGDSLKLKTPLKKGKSYLVEFNGVQYKCTAKEYDGYIFIGNNAIYEYDDGNETDTGEPFAFECEKDEPYLAVALADTVTEPPTIRITTEEEIVHKIDKKYLPEMPNVGKRGEGENSEIFNNYKENQALGYCSHAEGECTVANGMASHAEGLSCVASGDYSHAEGYCVESSGESSHAEGGNCVASEYGAHAEGTRCTASGYASHAEGNYTKAYGDYSHTEGFSTQAYGESSHAEGEQTEANGMRSHAEGYKTRAVNACDHAEGISTIAGGGGSHAEGEGTYADGYLQHVQGKYNIRNYGDYAHIVGNGETKKNRSNAHTLDWDGNAWFSGDVYVGSTSGTNMDEGSKKLITEDKLSDYYLKTEADTLHSELHDYVDTEVAALVNAAPETLDTLGELAVAFNENKEVVEALDASITNKQDKISDSLILVDAITGTQYKIQIHNGQLVSIPV